MARLDAWRLAAVLAVCWAIAASSLAVYFYTIATTQPAPRVELGRVMLIVDYGNGTFLIYNVTTHLPTTLFNLTAEVADVEYEVYEGLGVFVTSINNVANDPAQSKYWIWWYWNSTQSRWVEGPVGAGQFEVKGGEVLCWYYSSVSPGTWMVEPPTSKIITGLGTSEGSAG